jgi:alcohol dehydrogenase
MHFAHIAAERRAQHSWPEESAAMKMTAAVMFEQGKPRPYAESKPLAIEIVDLEGPGPGEVLVEIAGAGLCHSDLSAIEGNRVRAVPTVVGHEAAGIVREVGAGVTRVAVDDHVVMLFVASCGTCEVCTGGRPNLCQSSWDARAKGTLQSGARRLSLGGKPLNHYSGISCFAEFAVVSERSLMPLPKALPLLDAAILGCAVITGAGAVYNTAGDVRGKACAIIGLGGVGLSALLAAVEAGAQTIIAIDLSDAKLVLAAKLGATHTFRGDDPECAQKVRELTKGGVDVAFELAGSIPAMSLSYSLGKRGSLTVCGGLPGATQTFQLPQAALVADERVIKGSYMGSAVPSRDIPKLVDLVLDGALPIAKLRSDVIGFDRLNAGFDKLSDGHGVRQVLKCKA